MLKRGTQTPLNAMCSLVADHITQQEAVDECAMLFSRHLPRIRCLALKTHDHAFNTAMPWINSIVGLKHLRMLLDCESPQTEGWQVPMLRGLAPPSYSLVSFGVYNPRECALLVSPRVLGDLTLLTYLCTACTGDAQTVMQMFGDLGQCMASKCLDLKVSTTPLVALDLPELSFQKLKVLQMKIEKLEPMSLWNAPAVENLSLSGVSGALFQATLETWTALPTKYPSLQQLAVTVFNGTSSDCDSICHRNSNPATTRFPHRRITCLRIPAGLSADTSVRTSGYQLRKASTAHLNEPPTVDNPRPP